jgi:hypothetical protein
MSKYCFRKTDRDYLENALVPVPVLVPPEPGPKKSDFADP